MRFTYRSALLGLLFVACASPTEAVGTAPSEHNEGELISANDPHVWAEVSEADFGKGLSAPGEGPVAKDDVTTVRLQQWLDRYHAIVGDVMRERGESLVAPKPNAALFKQWGPNAWVSTSFACPSWNVRMSSGPADLHVMLTPDVAMSTDMSDRCITPINWSDPAAFVSFFNRQEHACRLSMSGPDLVVSGCQTYGNDAPLVTYAVSTTIGVTLDAITWGEEVRVARTLAHELGHYYRAHSNPTVRRHSDFFYRDTPDGPDRPVPAAESEEYERILAQIRYAPRTIQLKTKTRYSPRLPVVLFGLRSLCPNAQMSENAMRAVANGQINASNTAAYLSYERAIASCGKDLSLFDQTTSDQLDAVLRRNRVTLRWSSTAQTVDDALLDLSAQYDDIDRQEARLVAEMTEGKFGWYTDEQEADDIGLELAARAGFAPADVIEGTLRTYEQLDAVYAQNGADRGEEVSAATCKKWLAAGFTEKDADGNKKPVHVPLGSLSDPHHDGCYRVYNMWREAKRHAYVVGPELPALTPEWSEIQKSAAALGGSKPPSLDGKPTSPEGEDPEDTDGEIDPEAEAPPPRRPRPPVVADAGAGAPTMTTVVREGGCACSTTPSSSPGGLAAASLLAVALLVRRRRSAA